jgi:hypothetical protein
MHVNTRYIAGISIPNSAMARAATELMRDSQSRLLFAAASRTFVFASLIGHSRDVRFDPELLYIGALFLRVGVTALYRRSQQRFEVDSADAAVQFLRGYGRCSADIAQVWDAVALHTTPGIPEHKPGITALLAAGVETDLLGTHCHALGPQALELILGAFPREPEFNSKLLDTLARGQRHRPQSTHGTINADVLRFYDHRFRSVDYCARLMASTWPYQAPDP